MTDLLAEIKIDLVGVDREIGREQIARQPSRPAAAAQGAAMGVALNALMAGLSRGRAQTPRRNIQTGRTRTPQPWRGTPDDSVRTGDRGRTAAMRTPQPWTGRPDDSVRTGDTSVAARRVGRPPTMGLLRNEGDMRTQRVRRVRRRPLVGERPIEGDLIRERQVRQSDYDSMMRDVESGMEPRKAILRELRKSGSGSVSESRLLGMMRGDQIGESPLQRLPEGTIKVESTIKDYLKQNLEGFRESSR